MRDCIKKGMGWFMRTDIIQVYFRDSVLRGKNERNGVVVGVKLWVWSMGVANYAHPSGGKTQPRKPVHV